MWTPSSSPCLLPIFVVTRDRHAFSVPPHLGRCNLDIPCTTSLRLNWCRPATRQLPSIPSVGPFYSSSTHIWPAPTVAPTLPFIALLDVIYNTSRVIASLPNFRLSHPILVRTYLKQPLALKIHLPFPPSVPSACIFIIPCILRLSLSPISLSLPGRTAHIASCHKLPFTGHPAACSSPLVIFVLSFALFRPGLQVDTAETVSSQIISTASCSFTAFPRFLACFTFRPEHALDSVLVVKHEYPRLRHHALHLGVAGCNYSAGSCRRLRQWCEQSFPTAQHSVSTMCYCCGHHSHFSSHSHPAQRL